MISKRFLFGLLPSTKISNVIEYYEKIYIKEREVIVIKGILTLREREVFELLILNRNTKDIAEELGISEKTVRNHISNVMQKLGVKGRAGAVVELLKMNELSLDE